MGPARGWLVTVGLSQALTGWTGAISLTATITATVTPVDGDSVASVMSRLVQRAETLIGGTWQVVISASGVLTVSRPSGAFTLTTSGNTATRTALASASGASSYTGSGAHEGGVYPSRGMEVRPGTRVTTRGRVSGDGSRVIPGTPAPGPVTLVAHGTHAEQWALEAAAVGLYDVWAEGARGVFVRVNITEARRARLDKRADNGITVTLIGTEVLR